VRFWYKYATLAIMDFVVSFGRITRKFTAGEFWASIGAVPNWIFRIVTTDNVASPDVGFVTPNDVTTDGNAAYPYRNRSFNARTCAALNGDRDYWMSKYDNANATINLMTAVPVRARS
jgi:hypothetical protein